MLVRRFQTNDAFEVSTLIRKSILNRDNREYTLEQVYSIANHYSAENLIKDLDKKFILLCVEEGKIVGTGTLFGDELMTLFISPDYQNKGIGTKLMALLEEEAAKRGISRVWGVSALPAVEFYKRLGYSELNEKIHPAWGRAIVVEKHLK